MGGIMVAIRPKEKAVTTSCGFPGNKSKLLFSTTSQRNF
jgi:hypothetical protein